MMNWAILGPGSIAHHFAAALKEEGESLLAVGARNKMKGQAFAEKFDIPRVYEGFQGVLDDAEVDVVYIATPHAYHYETIMEALHHGKHVFAEKAITVNAKQLEEITDLAAEKQLIVAEAMTIYHMPIYKELQQLVDAGKIGAIQTLSVNFNSIKENDPENRFFNPELAGGALLDIGVYALSFVRLFIKDEPNEIISTVTKHETGVDQQAGIILKNRQGQLAAITLSFMVESPERATVMGTKGFIDIERFSRAEKATVCYIEEGNTEIMESGETAKALQYEVRAMKELIEKDVPHVTLPYTKDVMNIMDQLRKQWEISFSFE
ncbi:Predicted dehydrogenase [Terribacillus halophilus]|uniref:Predicted dehydrogenase n=1 Tax=Terribacillus halophilus TaxID=361279 RepID=A0A1G6LPV5_9BACI|nr:Gfo/Idh/MocA family oxidoreductase [Terribacillus halophilus]SDC45117.1 Predicted dehydrogenase [Terribacillus halophilus]